MIYKYIYRIVKQYSFLIFVLFASNQVIGSEKIIRNDFGQVTQINESCGNRVIENHFMTEVEFLEKLQPYNYICKKKSNQKPKSTLCNTASNQATIILPIPERGGIVRLIESNTNIQFETMGIFRCVGIGASNAERIGCLHYDQVTTLSSLKRFVNDLTDSGRLTQETSFFLVTNYLTNHLKELHDFLLENAKGSHIAIDASYELGGYVLWESYETTTSYFYNQVNSNAYLNEEKNSRKPLEGKALSFRVNFKDGETTYAFAASGMTERLQDYFIYLDSTYSFFAHFGPLSIELTSQNWQPHSPQNYWQRICSLEINTETKALQAIATKLYNYFKSKQIASPVELIYLYDSLEEKFI